MAKGAGRRKGSRNKGFYFRTGRGWYVLSGGKYVPLKDENGDQIRLKDTAQRVLKEAAAREPEPEPEEIPTEESAEPVNAPTQTKDAGIDVGTVCGAYLKYLNAAAGEFDSANPTGKAKTYIDRGQTLFDFCYGLPGEFFCGGDLKKREAKGDPEPKRIHDGYGAKPCSALTPSDVDAWLQSHKKWTESGWRTRIQALKRAFNFGVERELIEDSPIRGYKLPKSVARITYLTPLQQDAMQDAASPAFAIALKICIRTGARFGIEFAILTANHVRDHGDKMEWIFKEEESKTKKLRIVRITDPEIIQYVREAMAKYPSGPIFRNQNGAPWSRKMLSQNFRRTKQKVRKKNVVLDQNACMNSCRHSFAKRTLEGYWTGKPASLSTLARLMGNSVEVCIAHYLQFSIPDNEMLWGAA